MTGGVQRIALAITLTLPPPHGSDERAHAAAGGERGGVTLHTELLMPARARGLVVFVAACDSRELAAGGCAGERLRAAGFATLTTDLLGTNECRFAEAETHLPHLAERLLALLAYLQRQFDASALATQPVGLFAAGGMTPVAVRAAAVRDRMVKALVCRGGLVDLAGLQYLQALQAPLLMLIAAGDAKAAENFARAYPHFGGCAEAWPLGNDETAAADAAATWFGRHLVAGNPTASRS